MEEVKTKSRAEKTAINFFSSFLYENGQEPKILALQMMCVWNKIPIATMRQMHDFFLHLIGSSALKQRKIDGL